MFYYGERILLTIWVGGLWAIGYLAVPTLFATLDDRILAGMLAGKMFSVMSYLGLGVAVVLLVRLLLQLARPLSQWRVRLLLLMLLLVAVGEFSLQPMMADLKAGGLVEGSEEAVQFARLHGIASILYLVNSLSGLVLLALYSAPQSSLKAGE